tara:strand:+ start:422 stop:592 length:171 start_codon:yes stop_codon:yes gene_type:complete
MIKKGKQWSLQVHPERVAQIITNRQFMRNKKLLNSVGHQIVDISRYIFGDGPNWEK